MKETVNEVNSSRTMDLPFPAQYFEKDITLKARMLDIWQILEPDKIDGRGISPVPFHDH